MVFGEGTDYRLDHAEGFEGYESRTSDSDQPRGDGAIRGLDYVAPRTVAFTFSLAEVDSETYETRVAALRAAFAPSRSVDRDLMFKRPGRAERLIRARAVQLARVEEYKSFDQVGHPPVMLHAVDPRIYSSAQHSINATVYAAAGGRMDWPVANWSVDFTGATQNLASATLIRFYGPTTGTCTGVTLTNVTNGSVLAIATTSTTGQILPADMRARS